MQNWGQLKKLISEAAKVLKQTNTGKTPTTAFNYNCNLKHIDK